jgi:hypothetical protein
LLHGDVHSRALRFNGAQKKRRAVRDDGEQHGAEETHEGIWRSLLAALEVRLQYGRFDVPKDFIHPGYGFHECASAGCPATADFPTAVGCVALSKRPSADIAVASKGATNDVASTAGTSTGGKAKRPMKMMAASTHTSATTDITAGIWIFSSIRLCASFMEFSWRLAA